MTPDSPISTSERARIPVPLRIGSLVLATIVAAACTPNSESDEVEQAAATESPKSPAPTPEAAEPFTIAFGGDVHFEGMLRQRLDSDPATALGPISDTLSAADVAMVNLETAITDGGTPVPGKQFVFRAPDTAFDALASAGVDLATVANNHGMDYGTSGLKDTLDNAEQAEFPIVGAGLNADEAYAPHTMEVNGNKVAFIGASDVLDNHLIEQWTAGEGKPGLASSKGRMQQRLVSAVSAAAKEADTVVTFLHWGLESDHCALPHAPGLAESLVNAGADAVVGSHAHVLSPGGYLGGSYVHYGLGNFAFYNFSGPTAESGVLTLTMQNGDVTDDEWLPAQIQGGVPVPYEESAEQKRAMWEDMRPTCAPELSAEPGEEIPEL